MATDTRNANNSTKAVDKRHRLQLDFSPEAFERLLRIKEMSDASTNAEVVRNALRLYDWFLDQKDKGRRLQLLEGKTVKEVEVLF